MLRECTQNVFVDWPNGLNPSESIPWPGKRFELAPERVFDGLRNFRSLDYMEVIVPFDWRRSNGTKGNSSEKSSL
jgi:hypothetical protein